MQTALIGYTGFVGQNLTDQFLFTDNYNSQNIKDIEGKEYDLIVSAGTKSERWKVAQNPDEDLNNINLLLSYLAKTKTKHFILISTIDVYPNNNNALEDAVINENELTHPYGKHRYYLEQQVNKIFPRTTIIRCPQLYGKYLKKNFIYDLIHDNALDFTHKDTLLQCYNLDNLWKDIQITIENNLKVINLATEPATAAEIAKVARDMDFNTITEKPPMIFNMKSKYAGFWNSNDGYLYHKDEILKSIKALVQTERLKLNLK